MQLICPAGSLPALKAAVDHGADGVYVGLNDGTNARNFPGLNFTEKNINAAIEYAHAGKAKLLMTINIFPDFTKWEMATHAIDIAAEMGIDAVILGDIGLMQYASSHYPDLRLHLSVQGSATNIDAIELYRKEFGVQRVVLPRVLSLQQVKQIVANSQIEIEVFGFGSLCVMVEGRCYLSSYVTGESPNCSGVCSPAKAVTWHEQNGVKYSRLNGVLIDKYMPGESAGYPTLCKGRFETNGTTHYVMEQPTSLNTLDILPELIRVGISAIKVEGRQRSPAYVAQVTKVMRAAIDACQANTESYQPRREWYITLDQMAEGSRHTLGAFDRPWQ